MNFRKLTVLSCSFLALGLLPAAAQDGKPTGTFGNVHTSGKTKCVKEATDQGYNYSMVWDQIVFGDGGPCKPTLKLYDGGTWGSTTVFKGADSEGRTGDFRIYILSDDYAWKLGSSTEIEEDGAASNFLDLISQPEFFARLCGSDSAMGIGTASFEGNQASNRALAAKRADTIARFVEAGTRHCSTETVPTPYKVNLGEHKATSAGEADTAWQRRVIIVAAENQSLGLNIREALWQGLTEGELFDDFSVENYDTFVVEELS